jgi:hypothetical protein
LLHYSEGSVVVLR